MTDTAPHTGQHKERCGPCNGWRYDRAVERKAARERGEPIPEDADRVVPPDEGWNWRKPGDGEEPKDADAKWANAVLLRGFKGSQEAYVNGFGTPGQISVSNFVVGLLLARERPDFARRILRGIERGASASSGKPAEQFEREMREMAAELIQSLENETT